MAEELLVKDAPALSWPDVADREAMLVHRCVAGDETACGELVADHQRMVFQLAFHLLGDYEEARDLSQDVFLQVFRTIDRFRGQSALRTWIYRIAINLARNRQRWWRRRFKSDQVSLDAHVEQHGDDVLTDAAATPELALRRKETADRVWSALEALPFEQRTRDRAAGDRRAQLRGDRVLARDCDWHGEVAADARARRAAREAARGEVCMKPLSCVATRRRLSAFLDGELPMADAGGR